MFVKEYEKFKKNVKKTIYEFFKMEPEELENHLNEFHRLYDKMYNLDKVSYNDVRSDLKEMLMLYRTMNYFYNIWIKLDELEPVITNIGGIE